MRVAFAVLLEGVAVDAVAVELDDEPLLAPDGVDLIAGDALVDLRTWEAVAVDEAEELVLEDGARGGDVVPDEVAKARLVHGSGERAGGEDALEVVERAVRRCDGDAVVDGGVLRLERGGAMGVDAGMLVLAARGHVHRSVPGRCDAPQRCRGAVAQHGARAQASTAAIARACGDGGRWPTA